MIRIESISLLPGVSAIIIVLCSVCLTMRIMKAVVKRRAEDKSQRAKRNRYYVVTSTWAKCSGKECEVKREDRFEVLAKYKDTLLIEILGDDNNPYFIEESFIRRWSPIIQTSFRN
ncbi:MAG: hypothetical protein IKO41_05400 [Lachnospiraceae bacterium]|nr:hypothetical protein [Lachnospiraceae bacterium]